VPWLRRHQNQTKTGLVLFAGLFRYKRHRRVRSTSLEGTAFKEHHMSVLADFQVSGRFPSVATNPSTGPSTGQFYFPRLLGASIGTQSVSPSATSAAGQLAVPGYNVLNGQIFNVKAAGEFGSDTGDPSGFVTIALFANTGTVTSPIYTSIASIAGVPSFASAEPWSINATLVGTTNSGLCGGTYTATVGGVKSGTSGQNTTVVLSNIDFSSALPFGLVMGVKFGTGDASNKASLFQFQITQE
jgi:hypothetical protein